MLINETHLARVFATIFKVSHAHHSWFDGVVVVKVSVTVVVGKNWNVDSHQFVGDGTWNCINNMFNNELKMKNMFESLSKSQLVS